MRKAGRQRLRHLKNAAELLQQAGYGTRNAARDQLIGRRHWRWKIVEAGETMYLNGIDEATVGQMMNDFAERNMRRTEVLRACRFAVQQHKAHTEGARIRQQLWNRSRHAGRWQGGAPPSSGRAGANGPGPAFHGGRPSPSGVRAANRAAREEAGARAIKGAEGLAFRPSGPWDLGVWAEFGTRS